VKIGDLVAYVEADMGGSVPIVGRAGLILSGPRRDSDRHPPGRRWEVYWMYCNKIGWWDEFRLEVINESR